MEDLVIFGAGDLAQLAHFYLSREGRFRVRGFVVDEGYARAPEFCGLPLSPLAEVTRRYPPGSHRAFVAVSYGGMNALREAKYLEMKALGYRFLTYVSPHATCFTEAIGENTFVFEDNTLQPFTKIGNNVILWSGNHIGHHSEIGDGTFVSSHVVVSGRVKVGRRCFLGVNAALRDGVTLGDGCMVGAGSVVTKDLPAGSVYRAPHSTRV